MSQELSLVANPRDYEVYFASAIDRHKATATSAEDSSPLATAIDRSSVSLESIPPFDASPYSPFYARWYEALLHFSLLFYGFGSKCELLHDFAVSILGRRGFVVEIDAFSGQPRLLQSAVNAVFDLIDCDVHPRTMGALATALGRRHQRAFVVVNSIDSDFCADADTREALLDAADSRSIFIAASADRPPAFPLSFYTRMRFMTVRADTMRPYAQEIGFGSGARSGSAADSVDRFALVLKTLTGTANGIFRILLAHQVKTGDGLQRSDWLDRAISELCMRLQAAFRAQVNEFVDHRLVVERKADFYTVPLTHVQLRALRALLAALDGQEE
jgi:origin recognition complex subunit 2